MPFWKKTQRPRTSVPDLMPLVDCWNLSKRHHEWSPGASDEEIAGAEVALKRRLPKVLRAVYEMSNGLGLVGGNLNFLPLESSDDSELTLVSMPSMLREWNSSFPEELLFFGDDGGESQFALWLPEGQACADDCPVIEICEMSVMSMAGTSLCCFAKGRTAYYLLAEGAAAKSLDALGLPAGLRSDDSDDEDFVRIIRWADPNFSEPHFDPFENPCTTEELRARFSSPIPPPTGS